MYYNWKPKDIVAMLVIGGYIVYSIAHNNAMVPATVMLIVGYYFARRDEPDHGPQDNGKSTE